MMNRLELLETAKVAMDKAREAAESGGVGGE